MDYSSYEFNPIYSLTNESNVYNITHSDQEYPNTCYNGSPGVGNCPEILIHQWGRFNDLIVYSDYFQQNNTFQLTISDMKSQQVLGTVGEQSL